MRNVVAISTLVAETAFIDEEGRKVVSKIYRTRRDAYFIDHQIETGIDAQGAPQFDHWFEPISLEELVDGLPSEEIILYDQTLLFRPRKPTVSAVRRLTPSEIEALRQDVKRTHQRLRELLDEEEKHTSTARPGIAGLAGDRRPATGQSWWRRLRAK